MIVRSAPARVALRALVVLAVLVFSFDSHAQSRRVLHFRVGDWQPPASAALLAGAGPRHVIVQFDAPVDRAVLESLRAQGLTALRFIPDDAVLARVDAGADLSTLAGARWMGPLPPAAKISADTRRWQDRPDAGPSLQLVTVHPDVGPTEAVAAVDAAGAVVVGRDGLGEHVMLVRVTPAVVDALADTDAVAWIVPASDAVARGDGGPWCPELATVAGLGVAEYALHGEGWDGPGQGQAELTYVLGRPASSFAGTSAEVERALTEWTRHAGLRFTEVANRRQFESIEFDWLPARHADLSDGYARNNDPDFSSNTLAHAFFPDANEPYAADVHFNDEHFRWHAGGPTNDGSANVFDVALHEVGHSLGLAHSSDPNAVMYPYLGGRTFSGLTADDIAAIQSIYQAAAFCDIDVTPRTQRIGSNGGLVTFAVSSGPACTWSVKGIPVFMSLESASRSTGSGTAKLGVGRNTSPFPREASVKIAGTTVTVLQDAGPCVTDFSPSSLTIEAVPWEFSLHVYHSVGCAWVPRASAPWIKVVADYSSALSGVGRVTFSFDRNFTLRERTGTVTVDTFVLRLTQKASPDADADGMPDTWEAAVGLDPAVPDASVDADNDGVSNEAEFAQGTHPRGFFTRYFAEGATSAFFDTRFAILNPGDAAAHALMRFLEPNAPPTSHLVDVPGKRRVTVTAAAVDGLKSAEFSTVIESDEELVADRTLTWDRTGYGSHGETSVAGPSSSWYFAEGATHSGFQLFYLVQNPASTVAHLSVQFLRPAPAVPVVKEYVLAPMSRTNIWVNAEGPELASTDVSAILTSDVPVIAERAMYRDADGVTFAAGHAAAGVTAPGDAWYFAEGATGPYLDTFLLLANPGAADADVEVHYLLPDGSSQSIRYVVPKRSRFNIWVDYEAAGLADTAMSIVVKSRDVPIIAERAVWWPDTAWHEAHVSPGATTPGTLWAVAEGESGGPSNAKSYVLVANTSDIEAIVHVTWVYEDTTRSGGFWMPPHSRYTIDTNEGSPSTVRRFGMIVESVGTNPAAIVVERAMYSDANGVAWAAGSGALATRLR